MNLELAIQQIKVLDRRTLAELVIRYDPVASASGKGRRLVAATATRIACWGCDDADMPLVVVRGRVMCVPCSMQLGRHR